MRLSAIVGPLVLLVACTTSEEPGVDHEPVQLGGKTDMPASGGDFTFSIADLARHGELSISGLRCPTGEVCDFGFGLDLSEDASTPAERAIRDYNMLVDAEYLDAGAQRTSTSQRVTLRSDGGGFSLLGGTFEIAGTQVKYTIRPDIDFDLSGPSISLQGIRFRGSIDLCGGVPCSW